MNEHQRRRQPQPLISAIAGLWLTSNLLRPLRLSLALAAAPFFETVRSAMPFCSAGSPIQVMLTHKHCHQTWLLPLHLQGLNRIMEWTGVKSKGLAFGVMLLLIAAGTLTMVVVAVVVCGGIPPGTFGGP